MCDLILSFETAYIEDSCIHVGGEFDIMIFIYV